MNIILIMIPLSLLLLIGAVFMFFWAVNKGQFDDLDSPALSPVSDNLPEEEPDNEEDTVEPQASTQQINPTESDAQAVHADKKD